MKRLELHLMAQISWYKQNEVELEELVRIDPSEENYYALIMTKDKIEMLNADLDDVK